MLDVAFNDTALPRAGDRQKARDLLAAIRTLKQLDGRPPTEDERARLRRFPGFGCLALRIFPDPVLSSYKDAFWEEQGQALAALLTPEEYASARRTTFNAFYTSPLVMETAFACLRRFGLPADAHVLEPGCGSGNFIGAAPASLRFTGIEQDIISGRIAQALYPGHDIRIENFRDTKLSRVDAVVGNVPFANITLDHPAGRLSLHDYFIAKSLDILAPGGVLALVSSRFTLDKGSSAARDYLAAGADLLGAIRLPDTAFRDQGTEVVTDLLFLRKRLAAEPPRPGPDWTRARPITIGGQEVAINGWYAERPDMVIGSFAVDRGMHGRHTLRVLAPPDYEDRIAQATETLPRGVYAAAPADDLTFVPPFTQPPGLQEGAFIVAGPDRALMQLECGELVPVTHGDAPLRAGGSLLGRRIAALIDLKDRARRVLQTQNDGMAPSIRIEARRALNRAYDSFRANYGPINKTTLSVNAQGHTVRRMPNLARFREDPDAFLVMSLEMYDEATGEAAKAPILMQDVVGPCAPVDAVQTAEEGLLVSLNERGRVDLPLIASLYGQPDDRIIEELGDLIFHDPESAHVTRDEYLSGNVRRKLGIARASADPRHARNVAALEAVQPEDILPGDIDANLGAPWIPEEIIRQFAAELLSVALSSITVGRLRQDALWTIDGDHQAKASVANTEEFGTKRIHALSLIDQALNLRTPKVYDEFREPDGSNRRVLNQEQTVAAQEKQRRIKQRFSEWIFEEPERADALVRLYNDAFNSIRPRQFDGSYLTFPGMASSVTLSPHQVNAVWRIVSSGNTLLAHAVGAGKTYAMCAAAMKLRQAGLVRKSLIAVPNHMLEQFGREFLHLYPNARLLIAGKEDLAQDRRKLLTAKIASGDWDAIIVTHSSFERIGMSHEFQKSFLEDRIAEYRGLLVDAKRDRAGAGGNMLKAIEKRMAAFEEKLKDLAAAGKKDRGLVFDDLGVDQLFVDEAHYFKNLETPTKMDRVAGIQTEGSERAFDLLMKARYLDRQHEGRGLVFATGTPVSNTMVEMYTMQRYLAPAMLEERGIAHFDAWAAAFGEVVVAMEISPDGSSLRSNARFARFVNLPELQQMFRAFADVQTADMLKLPVPAMRGGKPAVIPCPMSPDQAAIQADLVRRYERVRSGGVDPRIDNALVITTDGRKLALDARLVSPGAQDWGDGKLTALFNNAVEIWRGTAPERGTQMIFCDIGVNATDWGFSVYDQVKAGLAARGVPAAEIADIRDASTDAKKGALFEKVRAGTIRFLLGSTAKMGTGTNVQTRLKAKHDLDAPWKPAEIEQRDGRIIRQGNRWPEVELYRYVTEGSFDAYMWQTLQTKARFIAQVMKGEIGARRISDIGGQELSFAEVKAIASGNPAVLTLAEIEADLQRLAILKRAHADEQYRARQQAKSLPDEIERLARKAAALAEDAARGLEAGAAITVGERTYAVREDAIEAMNALLKRRLSAGALSPPSAPVGAYRGFRMSLATRPGAAPELAIAGALTYYREFRTIAAGALLNYIDALIERLPKLARDELDRRALRLTQLEGFRARIGQPFGDEERLDRLRQLHGQLEAALAGSGDDRAAVDRLVAEYRSLQEGTRPKATSIPQEATSIPQATLLDLEGLAPAFRSAAAPLPRRRRSISTPSPAARQAALRGAQLSLF